MKTVTLLYKTDVPNCNGNIYPKEVVREALKDYTEEIKKGKALGVFGQDNSTGIDINIKDVSHIITGYEEVPEGFMISAKMLETPNGVMLAGILDVEQKDGRCDLRFGTRCTAKLDGNIIKNMKLISIDFLPIEYEGK